MAAWHTSQRMTHSDAEAPEQALLEQREITLHLLASGRQVLRQAEATLERSNEQRAPGAWVDALTAR